MLIANSKYPRNIESEKNITFIPSAFGICNKRSFVHTRRIGEMHLKNVAAGFNIKTNR